MKTVLFIILFLPIASTCLSQVDSMIVEFNGDSSVSYTMSEVNKISFSEGPLTGVRDRQRMAEILESFTVRQNYPNPFNPSTNIEFVIPRAGIVTAEIYDINGRRVRQLESGSRTAGTHMLRWNGHTDNGLSAASGTYFCLVRYNGAFLARKLLLLK